MVVLFGLSFCCTDASKVLIPSISLYSMCYSLLGMRIFCLLKITLKSSISHLEQISVISVWRSSTDIYFNLLCILNLHINALRLYLITHEVVKGT